MPSSPGPAACSGYGRAGRCAGWEPASCPAPKNCGIQPQPWRAIKGRNNRTTERRLRLALVRARIKGWVCPERTQGNPDFGFPERRLAVFVDGCFWHGCPVCRRAPKSHTEFWTAKIERNRAKDRTTTQKLESAGVRVLRVWEHELKKDLAGCVRAVQLAVQLPTAAR
jgi:DNA mismatch endonuclease (patch repair protein)